MRYALIDSVTGQKVNTIVVDDVSTWAPPEGTAIVDDAEWERDNSPSPLPVRAPSLAELRAKAVAAVRSRWEETWLSQAMIETDPLPEVAAYKAALLERKVDGDRT